MLQTGEQSRNTQLPPRCRDPRDPMKGGGSRLWCEVERDGAKPPGGDFRCRLTHNDILHQPSASVQMAPSGISPTLPFTPVLPQTRLVNSSSQGSLRYLDRSYADSPLRTPQHHFPHPNSFLSSLYICCHMHRDDTFPRSVPKASCPPGTVGFHTARDDATRPSTDRGQARAGTEQ